MERHVILRETWNYLVVDEKPEPVDVIIVLSGGPGRVEHAVDLFKQGYAGKMIMSGGGGSYMDRQAELLGVPAEDIIVEGRSDTTFTNAKYSLEVMKAKGFKSAIVVTSSYHTRRASIIFHEFFKGYNLTFSAAPYDSINGDNWWRDRSAIRIVVSEYLKLLYHYLFEH